MATEEFIKRSISAGKPYEALPERIRASVSLSDWKYRVKGFCIQRGFAWGDSLAKAACAEVEYYEDLLAFYQQNLRIFPYHLSDYVCRVLRISPFKYCCNLLYTVMRDEKSYDRIPNFTAADVVRLTGIGRNEYISILNKCKAKKLLWRVNRAIVKEMLPLEPVDIEMQPWWTVNVVNLGEAEYRQLSAEEASICHDACKPEGLRVQDVGAASLQPLYKRGLVYFDVKIRPSDHVAIPPLEGFVSNKDSEAQEEKGDPLEAVLYGVFVATSAHATVADLARMLSVDQARVQAAVSVACRLGFAVRLPPPGEETASQASGDTTARDLELGVDVDAGGNDGATAATSPAGAEGMGQGIALVVDAEVTSYLMMGAMSPGLKRHSVTLFEGGRVTGAEVIEELVQELHASAEVAQQFEGEMQKLASHASALAVALECIRGAAGQRSIDLLRKESLAGLAPAAAARVLSHAYAAVVPVAPLPAPPLPLTPTRPGPTYFGATAEAGTPWLQLALYQAAGGGPAGLVLPAGQRFWRLPASLGACSHALLWPWDAAAVKAQEVPIVVDSTFLLYSLNEHLKRTPLLVQPLVGNISCDPGQLPVVDVPLPLPGTGQAIAGFLPDSGEAEQVDLPPGVVAAASELGLSQAVGRLRLLKVAGTEAEAEWLPLSLQLGLPLQPEQLCSAVCRAAAEARFLEPETRRRHEQGQAALQASLFRLISEFGACSNCLAPAKPEEALGFVDLPLHNLALRQGRLSRIDLSGVSQGCAALFVD